MHKGSDGTGKKKKKTRKSREKEKGAKKRKNTNQNQLQPNISQVEYRKSKDHLDSKPGSLGNK